MLKDADFLSVYITLYIVYVYVICLHCVDGRCAKTEKASYGSCETRNKQCGSYILTTKLVTRTNCYSNNTKHFIACDISTYR